MSMRNSRLSSTKSPHHRLHDVVGIEEFEGRFAGGVVAAGQLHVAEIEVAAGEFLHYLARKLRRKGQVVLGVDHHAALRPARVLIHVTGGADAGPGPAKSAQLDGWFGAGADMARGLA